MWQDAAVVLVVAAAALYAVWSLMPQGWRRRLAQRLGRPAPATACGGCDACAAPPESAATAPSAVVKVYRKRR